MSADPIMENSRMIHKANQIAAFFEAYPEERAIAGVADHIQKFWTPAMRAQLQDYIASQNGEGLHATVIKAAQAL